jgi:hypothetical protein
MTSFSATSPPNSCDIESLTCSYQLKYTKTRLLSSFTRLNKHVLVDDLNKRAAIVIRTGSPCFFNCLSIGCGDYVLIEFEPNPAASYMRTSIFNTFLCMMSVVLDTSCTRIELQNSRPIIFRYTIVRRSLFSNQHPEATGALTAFLMRLTLLPHDHGPWIRDFAAVLPTTGPPLVPSRTHA